jgi:acetylglutamate kinase
VTSAAALAVVRDSFAAVNGGLCDAIGPLAVPLFGDEIGLDAVRLPELGYVGSPLPSSPPAIEDAFAAGLVPVVAPLAVGPLNVNADEAAAALAVGLGADKLLFVTDVPGLLLGGAVASKIHVAEAERLLAAGALGGGIVPKLEAAVAATRGGVDASIGATAVVA